MNFICVRSVLRAIFTEDPSQVHNNISVLNDLKDIDFIPSIKRFEAYVVIVIPPWKPSLTGNTGFSTV